jgi:tRNA(fMet)-specific endonuclease VapC
VKARTAQKYLAKVLRKDRPKYIEEWVDKASGQKLGIDENDLWMCAQAKERDLIFVTADGRMKRIPDADPDVRLLTI